MQVQNNPQMASATSFKAIKSVKCEGLYKKFPEEGKKLVDAFKNNSKAMDFCKKYDVNVVFYAVKEQFESVASSLHIFFKNPAKKKFLGFLGSQQDKIELSGYGNAYEVKKSLVNSTQHLVDYMLESTPGKSVSGLLNQHLKLKEEEIQKVLNKPKLEEGSNIYTYAEAHRKWKKQELDNSIKDLIEHSK